MNSRAADSVYRHMQNKILHDDQATCMLVEVIATKSRNEKWFYDNLSHEKIRRVSIDKFYASCSMTNWPSSSCARHCLPYWTM